MSGPDERLRAKWSRRTLLIPPGPAPQALFPGPHGRGRREGRPMDNQALSNGDVHVRLFGGPVVSFGKGDIGFTPNQRSLVTLIYGRARRVTSRSDAIWLMWEGDDDADSRHRLRQLLHGIRKRAGRELVLTEGDNLSVPTSLKTDIASFEAMLEAGTLGDAARLTSLGFGSGLTRLPSREYEDWIQARRAGLSRRLGEAAARAWDQSVEHGDWSRANDAADALVRVRPGDESAIAKLIEARARVGRAASAEAAYAGYLKSLDAGQPPTPKLTALMERVRDLELSHPDSGIVVARNVPLVGRKEPLELAREVLSRAAEGRFERLVVRGEPGIGKTRFLEELRREAVLSGFRCLSAQPVELEQRIGLNPIIDALRDVDVRRHLDALGEPWKAVIASVLPEGATDGPPAEIPPIQESSLSRRLMDAFWMLFDQLAAEDPLLIIVDDVQWADPTTLSLLSFMARRWESGGVALCCSVRPELVRGNKALGVFLSPTDPIPNTEVVLEELSDSEAGQLLEHVAGKDLQEPVEAYLRQLAGNHPFYLTELAKDHVAGRLSLPVHRLDAIPIPVSVQQIFQARIGHISDEALRVASLLSVRARSMRLSEIGEVADRELDECADLVEQLQEWHFVEVDRDTVRISHELFRSALYRRLSETRRALIHGRIARQLESTQSPDVVGELAIHYARAGERIKAVEFAQIAAREALGTGAVTAAAQYFEIVVKNSDDPTEKAEATADLAKTLHMDRQIERANPMLEVAAMRLRDVGNMLRARRMEIRRVEGLSELGASPVEDLVERLGVVKREAEEAEDWEAVALGLDAELHLRRGSVDVASVGAVLQQLRVLSEGHGEAAACVSLMSLGIEVLYGRPRAGIRAALRGERLTRTALPQYRFRALQRLHSVLVTRGLTELDSSAKYVDEAKVLAVTSGDLHLKCGLQSNLGVACLDAGDLERAEVLLLGAFKQVGHASMALPRFNQQISLGELYLARLEFRLARVAFDRAMDHAQGFARADVRAIGAAGLGLCAVREGSLREARQRESELSQPQFGWDFDPYLIVAFRAQLLVMRRQFDEAVQLVRGEADTLQGRLILPWFKLRLLEAEISLRTNQGIDKTRTADALREAMRLNLTARAGQFEHLLERGNS
jgi:DNA-binding SARP family transcriptional activator